MDVLQMWCLAGATKAVLVRQERQEGIIHLVEGEVRHAEAGDREGEEAFYTILGWRDARVECIGSDPPGTVTIHLHWLDLIMEAGCRMDEDPHAAETGPPDAGAIGNAEAPADARKAGAPIRVLIVDDSAVMRKALSAELAGDGFLVAGTASNGAEALSMIPITAPDVITLDVNMPVMDGISALKRIMIQQPVPTVMVSAFTREGATVTFDALRYGAVDVVSKPSLMPGGARGHRSGDIRERVRLASRVAINAVRYIRAGSRKDEAPCLRPGLECVVALGAGEGGYGSLLKIVPQLPPHLPAAVVAVLYEAPPHVEAFSRYLDQHSRISVTPAADGGALHGGTCYLASGDRYVTAEIMDGRPVLRISPPSFPDRRGSIDILMISLAEKTGLKIVGAVLSGAAADGAEGVREIFRSGGAALVQDPQSCLMREMPEAALAACADARVVSDQKMASEIVRLARQTVACPPVASDMETLQ